MRKFKKIAIVVEAAQWQPGTALDGVVTDPAQISAPATKHKVQESITDGIAQVGAVKTLDGWRNIHPGDYLIKKDGDFYFYTKEEFESTFEPIETTTAPAVIDPHY